MYRGHEINQKHSLRKVSRTLLKLAKKSQFASLNVIGIPGSGKTSAVVNIVQDFIEMANKEEDESYSVEWAGAEELRDLGNYIEALPKNQNHVRIFDDVSKALDKLDKDAQADIFEKLTTTRHTTGGKLILISLYHYTYANLKSVKSQAVVNIYTSLTLVEKQNVLAMLGNDKKSISNMRKFLKAYESSIMYDDFELIIGKGRKKVFVADHPFRPCFVINLTKTHLSLFMKLDDSPFWPPEQKKKSIKTKELIELGYETYEDHFDRALRIHAMLKGVPNAVDHGLKGAFKYISEKIIPVYNVKWHEVPSMYKFTEKTRFHRKRKAERLADQKIRENPDKYLEEENVKDEASEG